MSDMNHRYSRQMLLPEIGSEGQERLLAARILIVGCGGLGSPVAYYLAAAGVGTIGLVDFDHVDVSNLQRQILYSTNDVGLAKVATTKKRLNDLNPSLRVVEHSTRLNQGNILDIVRGYDLVVDGTDNFPTRYLINDACVLLHKAYVYGSIFRFEGTVSLFAPHLEGPCYRCLYPEPPEKGAVPNCAQAGVLGSVCGVVGTIQANEALKWVLNVGRNLKGRLLRFDALEMDFSELRIAKDPNCAACGAHAQLKEIVSVDDLCEKESMMQDDVTVEWVDGLMKQGADFQFIDVRRPEEYATCHIKGTKLVPMNELPSRLNEISKDKLVVLHCHHGGRSRRAVEFLKAQGYTQVKNLAGGIDRWSQAIDSSVPRY